MRSAYLRYEHKHTTIDSIVKHTKNPRSAPRTRTGRGLAADASSKFTRVYIGCRHTTSAFLTRPPVSQLPPQRQLLSSQVRRFAYANEPPFQFFLFTASSAFIEKNFFLQNFKNYKLRPCFFFPVETGATTWCMQMSRWRHRGHWPVTTFFNQKKTKTKNKNKKCSKRPKWLKMGKCPFSCLASYEREQHANEAMANDAQ